MNKKTRKKQKLDDGTSTGALPAPRYVGTGDSNQTPSPEAVATINLQLTDVQGSLDDADSIEQAEPTGTSTLTPKEFIARKQALSDIRLREGALIFLYWAYGGLLTLTMLIMFLQGFKLWGFGLDNALLMWLGGATVGEVAGLAALVYGALFRRK